jgi:hypothetical protein
VSTPEFPGLPLSTHNARGGIDADFGDVEIFERSRNWEFELMCYATPPSDMPFVAKYINYVHRSEWHVYRVKGLGPDTPVS